MQSNVASWQTRQEVLSAVLERKALAAKRKLLATFPRETPASLAALGLGVIMLSMALRYWLEPTFNDKGQRYQDLELCLFYVGLCALGWQAMRQD